MSRPSDRAIAQAFRELAQATARCQPHWFAYRRLEERALTIDAAAPEGAQEIHQFRHKDCQDWYDATPQELPGLRGNLDIVTRVVYTAPPSLDAEGAALREDAECYRWLLPRLRVESDNGPELSRWESMVYLVGGSAWVPGSPSYTTVTQAINAARAAEGKG